MTNTSTSTALLPKLVTIARHLTDHLAAYAFDAENFDEEAFLACEMAETLLAEIGRVYGPLESPQALSELLDAARKRAEDGIDL